jgi:4'-phosphopantetheinyl transferase
MADAVDLWHVRTDALDAEAVEACLGLLTSDEKVQHARFRFDRHRHEYLVTRGLARGVLATYVDRPPGALSFRRTEHGRPLLEPRTELSFNLTNTLSLVACAVARSREVGVDAEPMDRGDQVLGVAETVFTTSERAMLAALELPARRRRAVELWTLKEAYMKARGLGFSLPVTKFEVRFEDDSASLAFHAPVEDAPDRWALRTVELEGHLVSTCIEVRGGEPPIAIEVRRADLGSLLARG